MADQVLTSLAILKVNWDQGKDYIENFIPFIAHCLLKISTNEISISELQKEISDTFKINIPQGALRTILHRSIRRNLVKLEKGIYTKNEKELRKIEFSKISADAERQQSALIKNIISFVKNKFNKEWNIAEAEIALFAYIKKRSMTMLSTIIESDPLPNVVNTIEDADFIVNSFIAEIIENDPIQFGYLETIVKGLMLLGVLYFSELGQVEMRFNKIKFIFDTSFLIRSLGYTSPAEHVSFRELLDLLYELNAELCVFEETVGEIRGVLSAALETISSFPLHLGHPQGEALEFFIQSKFTASDIELRIARLERDLKGLRISILPRPKYEENLGVDEDKFESILKNEIGYIRDKTLRHDLDSLTAIYRLRRGQSCYSLENCQAIFVTDNADLARVSFLFTKELTGRSDSVPYAICDHILTTVAWLKKPLKAPELPKRKIIADCFAAMNPPNELWRKYIYEVDSLKEQGNITDDDYYLLRYSTEAKQLLMENTRGNIRGFASGTISEILEKSKANIQAETKKELKDEREKREKIDAKLFNTLQQIRNICVGVGKLIRYLIFVFLIGILAYFSYVLFPWQSDISENIGQFTLSMAFAFLLIISIISFLESKWINNMLSIIEVGITEFLNRKILRILKLDK